MPRPRKGPHLYLKRRERFGRSSVWIIRDGESDRSTGCSEGELAQAEQALQAYIARKYSPPDKAADRLEAIAIADVMRAYLSEHAPTVARPDFIRDTARPILDWWGTKTLADIRGKTCREYVTWRVAKGVSDQTARHDLKTLRAAINYYHKEYGPLPAVPKLTLPEKGEGRTRWLTRSEAAAALRAARRLHRARYLTRVLLIGLYTGTRSGAMLKLRWLPSPDAGWFDLGNGVLYRRGEGERNTKKQRTPARIPERLMPHLRRWHRLDMAGEISGTMSSDAKRMRKRRATGKPIINVIHYHGRAVKKLRHSWDSMCQAAGLGDDVVPHTLRHTAATWLMQAGVDVFQAAGFLGMTAETLLEVYGHHHPDFQGQAARADYKRAAKNSPSTGPGKDPKTPVKVGKMASSTDNQVLEINGKIA